MRRTAAVAKVATALLSTPSVQHWGYDIGRRAKVRSGVLYPILARMLEAGILADGWEDPAAITDGRPPRRYYTITEAGQTALADLAVQP